MAFFLENFKLYQQQLLLWVDFYQHSQQKAIEDQQFLRGVWQRTHNQLLVFMDGLLLQCLYSRGFDELSWRENQSQLLINLLTLA
ncbi:MAG: hypothetical protein HC920_19500 [Oscillatoriales cyanobacterium SM2_3_0]|nr:hypothetical protein [Oscillatoriales cyanobacterium SM2_3_0]